MRSAASSTTTSRPAFAKYAAHTRPLCPAPITTIRLRSVILPTLRDEIWFAQVEQDLARSIRARRRHDAATRVRSRAAHVEALRRPAVLRETGERAVEQQLVHRQLALEDVALGQTHLVLELARRAHLDVGDQLPEAGAVDRDLVAHRRAKRCAVLPRRVP